MYGKLWKAVNHFVNKENAVSIYLGIAMVGWTVVVTALGMLVGIVVRSSVVASFSNSICAGIYAGIIFGLIGGILYLQRNVNIE